MLVLLLVSSFRNTSASKKGGRKYDVYDDSSESHVKDCLETIRQDVETIENNQANIKKT